MQDEYVEVECNQRIMKQIGLDLNLPQSLIEDVLKSVSSYTADVIRMGGMEGVMLPYLGKLQVKPESQQYRDYVIALGGEMKGYFKSNKTAVRELYGKEEPEDE